MKSLFDTVRKTKKKNAVLYACHSASPTVMDQFKSIKNDINKNTSLTISFHRNTLLTPRGIRKENRHVFTYKSLSKLGYPTLKKNKLIPGCVHFPLMDFALKHPDYSYYWFVEYDVRYSGSWSSFFDYWEDSSADLLTCHIRNYKEEPDWCWWKMQHPELEIPLNSRVRSFNPIYRISRAAISYIHNMHLDGWTGHNEVLLPTLLLQGGFTIEDIGGTGKFVSQENKNLFYFDAPDEKKGSLKDNDGSLGNATMRWRPNWDKYGEIKDKLYHPVKEHSKKE